MRGTLKYLLAPLMIKLGISWDMRLQEVLAAFNLVQVFPCIHWFSRTADIAGSWSQKPFARSTDTGLSICVMFYDFSIAINSYLYDGSYVIKSLLLRKPIPPLSALSGRTPSVLLESPILPPCRPANQPVREGAIRIPFGGPSVEWLLGAFDNNNQV